jgi:hypothetical protein
MIALLHSGLIVGDMVGGSDPYNRANTLLVSGSYAKFTISCGELGELPSRER